MPTDPSLQTARRAEILRILKQESITRQEDLVKALASRGMDATARGVCDGRSTRRGQSDGDQDIDRRGTERGRRSG